MKTHRQLRIVVHCWNFQLHAVVEDSLDGADVACRAGAKQFQKSFVVECSQNIAHEDWSLNHVELVPSAGQFQQTLPRDAGQDQSGGQWRSHQLLVAFLVDPESEEVHRAHLGHLVVRTIEPQHLNTPTNIPSSTTTTTTPASTPPKYLLTVVSLPSFLICCYQFSTTYVFLTNYQSLLLTRIIFATFLPSTCLVVVSLTIRFWTVIMQLGQPQ